MKFRFLSLLLVGCAAQGSASAPAELPSATPASAMPPSSAAAASPSAPAASPSAAPTPTASAEAPATKPEPEHAGHQHQHGHGNAGYHMDFSAVERFARHFDGPERDGWQKPTEVVRFLELGSGQTVADIGAGTGYFLPHLSKTAGEKGRVLALDVEPNMIEYMKQRSKKSGFANVEPRLVAPDDPGLPPGTVDHILIVNTWHHIDDRASYAGKLASALRPAGSILIVDFTLEADMGPPKQHRLSAEQVVKELEGGGFHAEVVRGETLPKQYIVRGVLSKGMSH
jgi:2-polyprenyl-3-methyl-5-hydroxy-6-metoxy-1,4-benzoquinol methylase